MDQVVSRFGRGRLLVSTAGLVATLAAVGSVLNWTYILQLDFAALLPYRIAFLRGLWLTLLATGLSTALGLVAGTALAALAQAPARSVRVATQAWLELWRDLPLVVVLFWIHFALPLLTGISTQAMVSGVIALSLQASAYLADVIGAGIRSIRHGQWEAADALGLPRRITWLRIVIPQALTVMLPSIVNIVLGYLKASAILALLPAGELASVGADIASRSYRPIETFFVVGAVYLLLGWTVASLGSRLEKRQAWLAA